MNRSVWPPHLTPGTFAPQRSLANVLADLKEARDDLLAAAYAQDPDADDRCTEAATRLEGLRDDLAARFQHETGLTIEQFRDAFAAALI